MANEFKVKNGLIVIGDLTTSGTITINGALAATQSWVTSQAYLTSSSLTSYATQSYVTSAIASLVDSAPGALDTLRELATALGNDASFSTTVTNSIAAKLPLAGGTLTGALSGTSATFSGAVSVGNLRASITNTIGWTGQGGFESITDGNFRLYNEGRNTYGNLTLGAATLSGALTGTSATFSDQLIASSTSGGTAAIFRNTGGQNSNGFELRGGTTGSTVNWKFEKDNTVSNTFQLTPSTTNGGTTYTTPVLTIASTGAATFSSTIASGGNINVGGQLTFTPAEARIISGSSTIAINNNANNTNLLLINNSTGNVGINTSSPAYKLDVSGDINFTSTLKFGGTTVLSNSGADVYGNIRVLCSTSSINDGMYLNYNSSGGTGAHLRFFASGATERMRIDASNGNVGIGTTSPAAPLDVNGNVYIRSTGTLYTNTIAGYSTNVVSIGASTNFVVPSGTLTVGSRLALQPSNFGYSSGYKTLLIGSAGTDYTTNAVSLAFNVDVSGNPSGAFTGNGYEYIWRNTGAFITPNAANTTYNTLFTWNSSGQLTFNQATTLSSSLTVERIQINSSTYEPLAINSSYGQVGLKFGLNGTYFAAIGSANNVTGAYAGSETDLGIGTSGSATANITFATGTGLGRRMTITAAGNVGIGTTSPSYKLHVSNNTNGFISRFTGGTSSDVNIGIYGYTGTFGSIGTESNHPLNIFTNGTDRMTISTSGKVSIGTTDTNSDKSDFTVYTGSGASLALVDDQVRMGSTDVNWGVALRSTGYLETYGQPLYLRTITGSQPVVIGPNGTNTVEFYPDYTLFNGLNFAISRVNSTHGAANYFRGDTGHLVIGTGGTLYLNYANTSGTTYIFGTTYINNEQVATRAWVGSQGYLTSVSDVWVNTSGDTMTGTLTIQGGWASTILDGDNVVLRKPNYSAGGWARTLLNFQEYDGTSLFQIGGYGSNNTMSYGYLGSAYNTPTFRWYADKRVIFDGSVGIGTDSPSAKLHVSSGQIQIGDSSSSFFGIRLSRTNTAVVQDAHLYSPSNNSPSVFYIEGGYYNSEAAGTVTAANSGYAYYERYFGNGAANSYKQLGFINVANGNFTSTNLVSSVTMLSNGNVGIGTTSPATLLDVAGTIKVAGNGSGYVEGYRIIWETPDTHRNIGANAFQIENVTSQGLTIGYSSNQFVVVNTSGNVGIGTTSPSTKLDVNGGSRFRGNLDLDADQKITGQYWVNNGIEFTYLRMYNGGDASINIGTKHSLGYISFESGNGAYTERMRITNTGNVGIGTTSPTEILNIARTGTDNYIKVEAGGQAANYSGIMLTEAGINWGWALRHNAATDLLHISYQNNTPTFSDTVTFNRNGNVGIGTASPIASLDNQGSAGTYRQRGITTLVTNTLGAVGEQAKRFEIARVTIDYNDWNSVGPIEVELYEKYFSQGLRKKYSVYYGYVSTSGVNLTEMTGVGQNNFQVTIGAEVVISGDLRYIPIYVDVRHYTSVTAILKTNRELSTSNPPELGAIWLNNAPTGTNISNFTADNLVYVGNINGGNSTFSTGYVGIGTTSPGVTLDVNGSGIRITDATNPNLYFNNGTVQWKTYLVSGGSHKFAINDAVRDVLTLGYNGGASYFQECNVGIGTTTPDTPLVVQGGSAGTGGWNRTATLSATYPGLIFNSNGTKWGGMAYDYSAAMRFWVNANNNDIFAGTLAMSILNNGNVGIGTSDPGAKLHVVGNAWINRPTNKVDNNGATEFGSRVEFNNAFAAGSTGYTVFNYPSASVFRIYADYDGNIGGLQPDLQLGLGYLTVKNSGGTIGNIGIGTTAPTHRLTVAGGNVLMFPSDNTRQLSFFSDSYGITASSGLELITGDYIRFRQGSTELARLTTTGLGIGTTTPQKKLDVNGTGIVASFGTTISPGQFAGIHFGYSESASNNDSYKKSAIVFERTDNHGQGGNASGKIHFLLNNIASASATSLSHSVMVIDTDSAATQGSARVGIGTTSPSTALTVNGVITATGGNSTNWNTAYSWGNHASVGYITSAGSISGNAATATALSTVTNYSAYNSANALLATPSGHNMSAAFINFTGGNSIAPFSMYRTGGDWPAPYGIGWGTGGESSGIFQRFSVNGSSLGKMTSYINNDGLGSFVWVTGTWEGTTYQGAGSNHYANEIMTLSNGGNLYVAGTISASNLSGTNTGDQTNISGNAATATYATTAGALSSMNISQFTNNSGYITGYTETDPIYVSERNSLQLNKTVHPTLLFSTLADYNKPSGYSTMIQPGSYQTPLPSHGYYHIIARRDGGGGYGALLQSYNSHDLYHGNTTESTTNISWYKIWNSGDFTSTNVSNWNTAYSWGNHASASYATTSYVTTQINNLINGAPGVLDTLDELAAALGDDANFATTVTNSIAGKVSKAGDTITTSNNYGLIINHTPSLGDFVDALVLRSTTSGQRAQLGFATVDSDGDHHRASIRAYKGTQALEGVFGIALRQPGGAHIQRLTLDYLGNLTIGGALTESSSIKLKENVETSEGNLEKVVNLRPVTYNKIGSQTKELGLIAEEVATVYPEFVQYDESGEPVGVNYSRLTAALIGAVKELTQRIETLENNG